MSVAVSAIIPTYNRETLLARAVNSVLEQAIEGEIEAIVVNDAGAPLGDADWTRDPRVKVLTTYRTERCVARNVGAAVSKGEYLHFLDDDDMLLPGAYRAMVVTADSTRAAWCYGAYEICDTEGNVEETGYPEASGDVFALMLADAGIPHQASLIRREVFFEAGGWDPRFIVGEDQDLMLRVAALGDYRFTNEIVARIRRGLDGSSSQWELSRRMWQMKSDKAFGRPDCLGRAIAGLRQNPDQGVRGRLVRRYVSSCARHMRTAPITSASRMGVACRLALPGVASPEFWAGLTRR